MSEEEPQFLTIGSGKSARRIAYRQSTPSHAKAPGVVWMAGLRSDMLGGKATAITEWAAANGHPCLRFDYSGHGESEGRFEDGTIGMWLEESLTAIATLTRGPQILIGSSMGGWLALLVLRALARGEAKLDKASVAGAILIAPAWDMTEELMFKDMPPAARAALETEGVWLRPSDYGSDPYPITRALIEEGRNHLMAGSVLDPGVPVRILQGRKDVDVPWQHAAALEHRLTGGRLKTTYVDDGDHRLSRPQDIARLTGLLDDLARG